MSGRIRTCVWDKNFHLLWDSETATEPLDDFLRRTTAHLPGGDQPTRFTANVTVDRTPEPDQPIGQEDCGVDPADPDYLDYQEAWERRQDDRHEQ